MSQRLEQAARFGHHIANIPVYPPEAPASTPVQRQHMTEVESAAPTEQHLNQTGLPDHLKAGIEHLSGFSLDSIKVHYNSDKPGRLNALAYAQGMDIHVAPGQERHLQHEAWHVVQQAQGRVRPTLQLKGGIQVNDDEGLEHEADVMGVKAVQMKGGMRDSRLEPRSLTQHLAPPRIGEAPCPSVVCACCRAPSPGLSVIQRHDDYAIESRSFLYPSPNEWPPAPNALPPVEVYFGRGEATLSKDVQSGLGELASRLATAQPAGGGPTKLTLRGYASEDEPNRPMLVSARLQAVQAALHGIGQGYQVIQEAKPDAGLGSSAYRERRLVEVFVGVVPAALSCANGGQVDCAREGANLELPQAIAEAGSMLDLAIQRVGTPKGQSIVKQLFGDVILPEHAVVKLVAMRAQVGLFSRRVALGARSGGYLCYNECQAGLKIRTDGRGWMARLLAGPDFAGQELASKASDVVHESAHGAPALDAKDHAYSWVRLFKALPARLHADNADSYAALVVWLNGGRMPIPAARTEFAGVDEGQANRIKVARAWIENYLTQAYLQTRDVYPALSLKIRTGAWPKEMLVPYWQRLYVVLSKAFGLTMPPKNDDLVKIAGIIYRLEQVQRAVAFETVMFHPPDQEPPKTEENLVLLPLHQDVLKETDPVRQTSAQLRWTLHTREEIPLNLVDAYTKLVSDVAGDFVGPLGGKPIRAQVPLVPKELE